MKVQNIKIEAIKPYERNTKKHPETQIRNIAESIKQFGFIQPLVLDNNNEIIIGHGRYFASQLLGMEEVPCVFVENLTKEQVRKLRILDNKLNESEWDDDLLKLELEDLDFGDFDVDFGLDFEEEEKEIIEDEAPEVDEENEPITQLGDIWQLGNHRLMCGDSTKQEDVAKLMNGNKADLLLTDPPYNVAYEGGTGMTIKNDNMESSRFLAFLSDAFNNLNNSLKEGGAFYVWFASREHINFETALNNNNLKVREELIWVKNALVLGRQDYQWRHEPCLYGWKDGASHYFIDDRTQTTVQEDVVKDFSKMKKEELVQFCKDLFSDKTSTTIIHEDKPVVSDLHPTMKPIKLIARLIKNSSKQREIVLDLFGGSGSTLIACEQINRNCYTMELDAKYCDVIIKRWENLTGKKAVKIN